MIKQIRFKILFLAVLLITVFMGCFNTNKTIKESEVQNTENQNTGDELWKQYMEVDVTSMEKMPPDSNCFLTLNHKKVSYYLKNKLEFSDDLIEYLINDSLIVYRMPNHLNFQIGYNRKDSIIILTKGHPEGGIPTGNMEFFGKNVESMSPFK